MSIDADLIPDVVVVVDGQGRLSHVNAAGTAALGDVTGLHGLEVVEALGIRDAHGGSITLSTVTAAGTRPIECMFRTRSADDITLSVTAASHADGTVVLVGRPTSEHSGIAIVSTVSHELRSPLTSVKGYVSLLLSRWDRLDDDSKREMLVQVNIDADRVTRLVGELLDISRLEAGRLVLRRQLVDVGELAESVVEKVRIGHPDLDCRVEIDGVDDVYADPDKITQVLTNLIENGAKYGRPEGMAVTASIDDSERTVVVAVSDRGEGIPSDELPKLFTKFFRRDHGRPDGTGLGLWISRGLVEAHGGRLTAESVLGEGSTFTFTLPLDSFETIHG